MLRSLINKGVNMKTIKHEVKLERSVKIILGAFAFGIILNAFVTPTGQELFGIKNGNLKNMTNIEVNLKRKKILNENLIQDDFISFNANYEKHVVTIFTDVDCGYCRKLHNEIKDYNDQGISVKYVAFPRSGLESNSYEKIVTAWCADDQRAALTQMKQGIDLDISMCSNHPVEKHYLLGQRIGITGTPAIITSSGELLPGYLPPLDLLERLD